MPIFSHKERSFSQKNLCSHVIFSTLFMKNPLLSWIYLVKNVNSVKTTIYYGPTGQKSAFFPDLSRKKRYSHSHMLSKKHPFCKNLLLCPDIVKKRPFSQQHRFFSFHFLKFSMTNPCCHAHSWSKKRQFCHNYTAKKVNRTPFFPIFHEKINAPMPIFCWKNIHYPKTTLLSCPYFVKKTFILPKIRCSHVIFFKIFMKNPPLSNLYLSKKRQFCQN